MRPEPWGATYAHVQNLLYEVSTVSMKPHSETAWITHERHQRVFVVIEGQCDLIIKDPPKTLKNGSHRIALTGEAVTVWRGASYKLVNHEDTPCSMVMVATGQVQKDVTLHVSPESRLGTGLHRQRLRSRRSSGSADSPAEQTPRTD